MSVKTDPAKYSLIAKTAFAPIYPYLAEQIKNKFGVTEGLCVDIGSGPGSLAIALAKITNLKVFSLDIQPEMTAIACENIKDAGLQGRIGALTSDVCRMPFSDNSIDLVVSRGSIFFWEDRVSAFREINRILKPGAVAYVGGGMGNEQIRAKVMETFANNEELRDADRPWDPKSDGKVPRLDSAQLEEDLCQAGISGKVIRENGIWIEIQKGK